MPALVPIRRHPAARCSGGGFDGIWRRYLGSAIGCLLWLWICSWRVRWFGRERPPERRILCFWHGRQMPLLAYEKRRGVVVMVSLSRDGAVQTGLLGALGMRVVRGSSSRRGAQGLRALTRALDGGGEGAFAVDGPRGPEHRAKAGAIVAARLSAAPMVPLGAAAHPAWRLQARWESFLVPWPFARVVVVEGEPLLATTTDAGTAALEAGIKDAEGRAEVLLGTWRRK